VSHLYDIQVTAEQLKAAAAWVEEGQGMSPVELAIEGAWLVVWQGDERIILETHGETV